MLECSHYDLDTQVFVLLIQPVHCLHCLTHFMSSCLFQLLFVCLSENEEQYVKVLLESHKMTLERYLSFYTTVSVRRRLTEGQGSSLNAYPRCLQSIMILKALRHFFMFTHYTKVITQHTTCMLFTHWYCDYVVSSNPPVRLFKILSNWQFGLCNF